MLPTPLLPSPSSGSTPRLKSFSPSPPKAPESMPKQQEAMTSSVKSDTTFLAENSSPLSARPDRERERAFADCAKEGRKQCNLDLMFAAYRNYVGYIY